MPTLTITANPLLASPVDVLGMTLAPGETATFSDQEELEIAQEDGDLIGLATDAAFGSTSSVMLGDGVITVPQSSAGQFLITIQWPTSGPFSIPLRDATGGETVVGATLPSIPGAGAEMISDDGVNWIGVLPVWTDGGYRVVTDAMLHVWEA